MGAHHPQPVAHQRVGAEHAEQQKTLERRREIERQLEEDLRALAADEGERDGKRGEEDSERVEPAEEGDRDRGEAVARRDRGLELPDLARDLDDAGKPGEPAGNREHGHRGAVRVEAAEARGARRLARDAKAVAEQRAAEDEGRREDGNQGEHRTEMHPAFGEERRQGRRRIEGDGLGEIHPLGVAPRSARQIVERELGDVDQHQAGQDLAHAEAHAQQRRNEAIERASGDAE